MARTGHCTRVLQGGKLEGVKRWVLIGIIVLGMAGAAGFLYLGGGPYVAAQLHWRLSRAPGGVELGGSGAPAIAWQRVERPDEGFRVDLPGDAKDLQVPAYNESGSAEPVKMLVASPDGETTFAVSWQDNPPVARVNNRLPERTLEMARDGMLARTRTTLASDSRLTLKGYPARDIAARNPSGGVLNARLIYAGERLYTLLALYPSSEARHERDVKHFFNSFQPAGQAGIPEAMPAASAPGS